MENFSQYLFKKAIHKYTGITGLITAVHMDLSGKIKMTVRPFNPDLRVFYNATLEDWNIY